MKVGILAGGMGTRLAEETEVRPKPMVEIGGRPILWHIMKHYAHYGFKDFSLGLGHKGEYIKRYMVEYATYNNNLTVDLRDGSVTRADNGEERGLEGRAHRHWNLHHDRRAHQKTGPLLGRLNVHAHLGGRCLGR